MTTATNPRRWPVWTSVVVLGLTAAIHVFAGTPEYLAAVDASGLTGETRGLAIALWHLASALLVLLPIGLTWAARTSPAAGRPVVFAVWSICVAFLAVLLGVDLANGAVIEPLMQWTLFVPGVILLPFTRLGAVPSSPNSQTVLPST